MRNRLPLILSASALVVAVLGATPLGHAAGRAIQAVPPFAKTAGYAKVSGDSAKLNGRRSTLSGAPGTIPVVGRSGKLPVSIGAVGPAGPVGPKGDQGPKGDTGAPGISGLQAVSGTSASNSNDKNFSVSCPPGKVLLGGGARTGPYAGIALTGSYPTGSPPSAIYAGATEVTPTANDWYIDITVICATVAQG